MKFEDLHDVEIGDILTCKDLDAVFKVVDIDISAKHTPIQVELLSSNSTELVSGALYNDEFDKSNEQWLYSSAAVFRDIVPNFEKFIDVEDLITLERLEPAQSFETAEPVDPVDPTKLVKSETLTASKAAEITKRRLVSEVLKRVEQTITNKIGVFDIKVQDLDLDPIAEDLENLGYRVRFSMKDDEFVISWDPNY